MFENYGIRITTIFKKAENYRKKLKHPYVGTEHLLLAILSTENEVSNKLKLYGLTYQSFYDELIKVVGTSNKDTDFVLYTPLLKRIIDLATNDALDNQDGKVTEKHLFLAMLEEGEGIAIRILVGMGLDLDAIYEEFKISLVQKKKEKLEIYEVGINLNQKISEEDHVIGREEEIEQIIETLLRKNKSNPLLIGKAGVGKTAIVEELVRRIKQGNVPLELANKTVVMVEMGSLVSGTKYRGEFEERLTKIIKEVIEDKNIILFIDEIHTIINAGGAEGAINASDILKPYLARGELKCIGATTIEEYYQTIFKDKALERRFHTILVEEPDEEKTKAILLGIKDSYEQHHHIKISDQNITDIVHLANQYLKQKNNPDKSIELLDMICASKKIKSFRTAKIMNLKKELKEVMKSKEQAIYHDDYEQASLCKEKENKIRAELKQLKTNNLIKIEYQDIIEMIAKNTNIPLLENKKTLYLKVKEDLHQKIIGQEEAINKILNQVWIKLNYEDKPLSLLLTGPSGVGKTETVKVIANSLFAGNLIRIDMSEYNLDTSVNKLIGVSAGYIGYEDPYLFQKVLEHPYAIILVDEIEKAHPRVLNLFLQILDEGFITDARGEKIDFTHTMIFMTSNIVNKQSVGFINHDIQIDNEHFSKEFLGRFQAIIPYKNFTKETLYNYVEENLKNKKVNIDELIAEAHCEMFGLRNLKQLINKYNNEIDIEKILENVV